MEKITFEILEGRVISLKKHERDSFFRFSLLFVGTFVLMFIFVAFLYYLDEYKRASKEIELENRLKYIECKKLNTSRDCRSADTAVYPNMDRIYANILYAFIAIMIIFIPISIILSYFSIGPVRRASHVIDCFIENIAHDLNTPINTIKLNAKSLIRLFGESDKLVRIVSSADQLSDMRHDLLSLSTEKTDIEINRILLKSFAKEIVDDFRLKHKSQKFDIFVEDMVLYVNHTDLRRIVQNLLSNSIKYNNNNNIIKIYTSENCLIIKDSGRGIQNLDRVFDRSYREFCNISGNGIGLSSVLAMADRNKLQIKINSKYGKGTTAYIDFSEAIEKG